MSLRREWSGPWAAAVSLPLVAACATSQAAAPEPAAPVAVRRAFDYVAVDGTPFGSATTHGRVTVIAFVTTFDMGSQVVARELSELSHRHRPRINVGAVVLEPPRHAPLAEVFAATLQLGYPVVMADAATLSHDGPFGPVPGVPTVVVLDAAGDEVFRREGTPAAGELERAVTLAERGGGPPETTPSAR